MIEEIIAQVERVLRIGLTIITAYLVALWIASIWWTFRDIRSRTRCFSLGVGLAIRSIVRRAGGNQAQDQQTCVPPSPTLAGPHMAQLACPRAGAGHAATSAGF